MFNLFNRSRTRYPTIREALVESGLTSASDPKRIAVLEHYGQYAGRRVNFFRAFDPGQHEHVLRSGHVEHEGLVVVDSRPQPEGGVPAREPANRTGHADDERLVFWDPARARSSEAALSAPAATWQNARSTPTPGATP